MTDQQMQKRKRTIYIYIRRRREKKKKDKISSITNKDEQWWKVRRIMKVHWS